MHNNCACCWVQYDILMHTCTDWIYVLTKLTFLPLHPLWVETWIIYQVSHAKGSLVQCSAEQSDREARSRVSREKKPEDVGYKEGCELGG